MILVFFRCSFWLAAVFGLLMMPLLIAQLFDVDYHDPARCTLDAATCDKLSTR